MPGPFGPLESSWAVLGAVVASVPRVELSWDGWTQAILSAAPAGAGGPFPVRRVEWSLVGRRWSSGPFTDILRAESVLVADDTG